MRTKTYMETVPLLAENCDITPSSPKFGVSR